MSQFSFRWLLVQNGVNLTLDKETKELFRAKRKLALALGSWPSADQLHAISALARLEACIEDGKGVSLLENDMGYFIEHNIIAQLSTSQAAAIGLPKDIPYELRLNITGPLMNTESKVLLAWHSKTGTRVRGKEVGSLFDDGRDIFRISDPIYSLIKAVDNFNDWDGNDLDDRLGRLSNLRLVTEQCLPNTIDLDQQLSDLRLVHASSVSLDIHIMQKVIDFDPVLFSKEVVASYFDNGEQVEESKQLLLPALQPKFVEQFRAKSNVKNSYVLGRNQFVFIDPSLRETLSCIKSLQQESPEIRARFAKSPQSFIKNYLLEKGMDDEAADTLIQSSFVETDSFSERVLQVGLWQPPILPFVKRSPNTWLPESFGLKVGSESYTIPETEIRTVATKLIHAIEVGENSIQLEGTGESMPANQHVLSAVNTLITEVMKGEPIEQSIPTEIAKDDTREHESSSGDEFEERKSVLIVENNFESETFKARFEERRVFSDYEVPEGLKNKPKDHQVEGMKWLQETWSLGYSGVLLADDMGLGKTYQTLGFLSWLFETRNKLGLGDKPALILAPTTLLGNWEREAKIHLDDGQSEGFELLYGNHLKDYKIHKGSGNDVTSGSKTLDIAKIKNAKWILTTYETMRDYHISLASLSLSCIVFDEVQKIKSPKSMMTNAAQSLNADFKLGLTGTPIENSLADIWTLFDTLMPGSLGLGDLKNFMAQYNSDNPSALRELKNRLSVGTITQPPPMLRRMKSEVAKDLPKKIEIMLDKTMPEQQARSYSDAVKLGKEGATGRAKMEAFQRMRNISLHPLHPDSEQAENGNEFVEMSARLKAVIDQLDAIYDRDDKVLIFIESIAMHEWLSYYIKQRYGLKKNPSRIYGAISSKERTKIVDSFQSPQNKGFDLLLLSPKAAGVGITLTAATHVIHLSRWWNPAVEDQCTDRAYRIGQEKDVTVYLPRSIHPLYSQASFDCVLHDLLERKRSLSREMLMPMESDSDFDEIFEQAIGVEE